MVSKTSKIQNDSKLRLFAQSPAMRTDRFAVLRSSRDILRDVVSEVKTRFIHYCPSVMADWKKNLIHHFLYFFSENENEILMKNLMNLMKNMNPLREVLRSTHISESESENLLWVEILKPM